MAQPPVHYRQPKRRSFPGDQPHFDDLGLTDTVYAVMYDPAGGTLWRPSWWFTERRKARKHARAFADLATALVAVVTATGDLTEPVAEARRRVEKAADFDRRLWDLHEALGGYDSAADVRIDCRQALCGLGDHRFCRHR